MSMDYTVKVEEARPASGERPSAGPVYRSIYAKDGLMELPAGLESPWQFLSDSAKRIPSGRMLGQRQVDEKQAGPYVWTTYQEVYDASLRMGSAIRSRGVNPGDRCGIYGSNCPQWLIAMEACNSQAITYVPLYDTLGANAVEFIINHAEVSIAFVQENKIPAILSCLPNCSTHLKTIVSFTHISSTQKEEAEERGVSCYSWEEFSQLGNLDCELPTKQRTGICTIMYTSGTTGEPKGVIITNAALMSEVLSTDHILSMTDRVCTEEDSYFSFLPLAHIYDQIIESYCIYKGSSIGFWRGDIRFLLDDLQELKPTMFCGVPRVYDRIYTGIASKVSSGGVLKKTLFQYAYNYKLANLEKGLPQEKAAPLLDKLVFDKIKQALGGRVHILLSGAAPLPRHVEEFFRVTNCSTLSQGYGKYIRIGYILTEASESCGLYLYKVDPPDIRNHKGTFGKALANHECRFKDKMLIWRTALTEAANLSGWTLMDGCSEAEFIQRIVVDILAQLNKRNHLNVAKYPTGIHSRVQDIYT